MSELITAPATLYVSNLVDGGQNWRMSTQDIPMELKLKATELHGQFGWAVFSVNPIQKDDLPKGMAKDESLTPSQRLRLVIRAKAERLNKDPDEYYKLRMKQIIEHEKAVV